jgi:hypothetical protein
MLTKADVRAIIIEILRKDRPYNSSQPPFQIAVIFDEFARIARSRGLKFNESLDAWLGDRPEIRPQLHGTVWDIVWDLIVEGIVRPGDAKSDHELPRLYVTEYGKAALQGITPYDPDGYLKAITDKVPNVDQVIMRYAAESAETLRRNCLLSSTVTLGCASEQAFLILLETYRDALNTADQTKLDKGIGKKWMIKTKHAEFMKSYEAVLKPKLQSAFGNNWINEFDTALQFVFNYLRNNRNDAGHPSDAAFSREMCLAHLIMLPSYLRVVYDVIEWSPKNKPV